MKIALLLIPLSFLSIQLSAQLSDEELGKQLIYKSKQLNYKEHNPKDVYRLELINDYEGRAPNIEKALIIPKGLANYSNLQELIIPYDVDWKVLLKFTKLPNLERVVIGKKEEDRLTRNWYYYNAHDWSLVFEALDKFPKLRILGLNYAPITYIPSNFNGPHLEEIYFRNGDYNWSYPDQPTYAKASKIEKNGWKFKWYSSFETLKKLPKLKKVGISKENYIELTNLIYTRELFKKDPLREIGKLKTWMLPWVAQKIMTEEDLDVIKNKSDEEYLDLLLNEAYQEELMANQGVYLKPSLHKELIDLFKTQGEENLSIRHQAIINYFYGVHLEGMEQFDEAEKYYKKWAELRSKESTDDSKLYMRWVHRKMAEFYSSMGKSQLARKEYEGFLTYLRKDDLFADFNGLMTMAKEYRDWKNADWLLETYYQYNLKHTGHSEWRYYWEKMSYDLYNAILEHYQARENDADWGGSSAWGDGSTNNDDSAWEKWGIRWIELSERYTGRYSDLFEPTISIMQRMYNFDKESEQVAYLEWAFLTAKIKDKLKRFGQGEASGEYYDLMVLFRMADMPDRALWSYQRHYELKIDDDKEIYYSFLNSCVATLVEKEETLLGKAEATLAEIARLGKKYPDDEEMQKWVIHNQDYIQSRLKGLRDKALPVSPQLIQETNHEHPITEPMVLQKTEQVMISDLPNWTVQSVHRLVWKGNELNQIPDVSLPETVGKLENLYELELQFLDFDENVIKELEIFMDETKFPYLNRVVIQGLGESWSKEERQRVFDYLERLPNLKILSVSGLSLGSLPKTFAGKNLEQLFLAGGDYQNSYRVDVNRPFPKSKDIDWLTSVGVLEKFPKLKRLNIGKAAYFDLIKAAETLKFYKKVDKDIVNKFKTWAYYELETGEMRPEDFKWSEGDKAKDFDLVLATVKKQNEEFIYEMNMDVSPNDLAPLTWDYAQKNWNDLTKDHQASVAYLYAEYLDQVKVMPNDALEYYQKWYAIRVAQGGDKALWAYRAMRDYYFSLGDEKSADAEHQNMLAVAAKKDLECLVSIACSDTYHYYQSMISLCNRYQRYELATEYAVKMMNESQLQHLDKYNSLWRNVTLTYRRVIAKYRDAKDRKNMEKWIKALYKLAAKDPLLRTQRVDDAIYAVAMERTSMDDEFFGLEEHIEYKELGMSFLDKKDPKALNVLVWEYAGLSILCRDDMKMIRGLEYYKLCYEHDLKTGRDGDLISTSALNTFVSELIYDDEALRKEGAACLAFFKKWKKKLKNNQTYQEWADHNIPFLENYVK